VRAVWWEWVCLKSVGCVLWTRRARARGGGWRLGPRARVAALSCVPHGAAAWVRVAAVAAAAGGKRVSTAGCLRATGGGADAPRVSLLCGCAAAQTLRG
jgi:hypothetical protein